MFFTVIGYSLVSILIFLIYLIKFFQDSTTAKTDRASWIVLILASLLWPITLPISILELKMKHHKFSLDKQASQVILIHLDVKTKKSPERSKPRFHREISYIFHDHETPDTKPNLRSDPK